MEFERISLDDIEKKLEQQPPERLPIEETAQTEPPKDEAPDELQVAPRGTTEETNINEYIAPPRAIAKDEAPDELQKGGAPYTKETAAQSAAAYVELLNLLFPQLCGMISGESPKRYELTKIQRAEYQETTERYFLTQKVKVSPGAAFFASTAAILGGILIVAFRDRSAKRKREFEATKAKQLAETNRQKIAKAAKAANSDKKTVPRGTIVKLPDPEQKIEKAVEHKYKLGNTPIYKDDIPEAMARDGRGRANYEIYGPDDETGEFDLVGYYKKDPDNNRLRYEDCQKEGQKPSLFVANLIEQCRLKGLSVKDTNKFIRNILKELPSF